MRLIEPAKTVLLFALIVSAGVLTWLNWRYGSAEQGAGAPERTYETNTYQTAATPSVVAFRGSDGRLYGARSSRDTETLFTAIEHMLGEALGAASAPEKTSEAAWIEAVAGNCVLISYPGAPPPDAIGVWLSARPHFDFQNGVRSILIADNGGILVLYTLDEYGAIYLLRTPLPFELPSYEPALPCYFARDEYKNVAVDLLVFEDEPELYRISGGPNTQISQSALLSAFRFDPNTRFKYTGENGSVVYVDATRTMRITADGTVYYRDAQEEAVIQVPEDAEVSERVRAVSMCYELLNEVRADYGDAELQLTGLTNSDTGLTLYFDYVCNGLRVLPEEPWGAVFNVSGGALISMQWQPCRFVADTGVVRLLPQKSAVLVAEEKRGASLQLLYTPGESGFWIPDWYYR